MKLTSVELGGLVDAVDYQVGLQELAQEMLKYSNLARLLQEASDKQVEVNFDPKAFMEIVIQVAALLNKITVEMVKLYKEQNKSTTVMLNKDIYNYPIKVAYVKNEAPECYN